MPAPLSTTIPIHRTTLRWRCQTGVAFTVMRRWGNPAPILERRSVPLKFRDASVRTGGPSFIAVEAEGIVVTGVEGLPGFTVVKGDVRAGGSGRKPGFACGQVDDRRTEAGRAGGRCGPGGAAVGGDS